jgi:integrase
MLPYRKDGITIAAVLDTRRPLQDNKYRVRIRVHINRLYKEYTTGKAFTKIEWESLSKNLFEPLPAMEWEVISELKSKDVKKSIDDIKNSFDIIKQHAVKLAEAESFSFEALDIELQRKNVADTINEFFKSKIQELTAEDREGTRLYYDNVLKGIIRYKGEKIPIKLITPDWLKGYQRFLLSEVKTSKKGKKVSKGKTFTTVGMHMRAIRAIMNTAKKKGIIKEINYPFGSDRYQIPTGESRKLALTIEQIGKIVNFEDGNPKTDLYRDLWFFSYLANGINFADLLRLKYSDIIGNEISWLREKTLHTSKHKKYITAYITPEMDYIIKKHGNTPAPDNYIFPFLKPGLAPKQQKVTVNDIIRRVNRKMKYIGEQTETGKISTYTARHSYATVLKRAGSNIAFISESLGHSDLKTTQDYLASFEQSERAKNAAFLTNFGNKNKKK